MSAPVDVLAVMESDARCAAESRGRHYDREVWEATAANSVAARAAVAELIAAAQGAEALAVALNTTQAAHIRRLQAALAACGVTS